MIRPLSIIIGIEDGAWRISSSRGTKGRWVTERVALDDVEGLRKKLLQYADENGVIPCPVMHSSSLDFPEEDGAPEGFDPYTVLDQVFKRN